MTETDNKTKHEHLLSPSFLEAMYKNQYEQRWRESRRQDWSLLGVAGTITVALVTLSVKVVELNLDFVVKSSLLIVLPIALIIFCEVGIRVLMAHQGVMNHANHIATGIEAYFGIEESGKNSTQNDELSVKLINTPNDPKLVYPSKATYMKAKPITYWKFNIDMIRHVRVQSAIGLLHRSFQFIACTILYLAILMVWEKLTL